MFEKTKINEKEAEYGPFFKKTDRPTTAKSIYRGGRLQTNVIWAKHKKLKKRFSPFRTLNLGPVVNVIKLFLEES